jgi:VanZ family protein
MRKNKFRWFAVALWMIVIFAFSHQAYSGRVTEKYLGEANIPVRKAGHISEFMVLFWLVRWALLKDQRETQISTGIVRDTESINSIKGTDTRLIVFAFLISLAYAASDEWHQGFVPGRSSSLADVAWDTSGISLGAIVLLAVLKFRAR